MFLEKQRYIHKHYFRHSYRLYFLPHYWLLLHQGYAL